MIFRDWDEFHNGYEPKMVYATTMKPKTCKGPILHKERSYFLTAISGKVMVELINENNNVESVSLFDDYEDYFRIIMVNPNNPIRIINASDYESATIINCASKAWHPDNHDTWKWNSWEEYRADLQK